MEISSSSFVLDGFVLSENTINAGVFATSILGVAKKDNSHLGRNTIKWLKPSDIVCNLCNLCNGCNNTCAGSCYSCVNKCYATCAGSCHGGCTDGCNASCNSACNGGCTSGCVSGCVSGCHGGCTTSCNATCASSCYNCTACTTACNNSCHKSCTGCNTCNSCQSCAGRACNTVNGMCSPSVMCLKNVESTCDQCYLRCNGGCTGSCAANTTGEACSTVTATPQPKTVTNPYAGAISCPCFGCQNTVTGNPGCNGNGYGYDTPNETKFLNGDGEEAYVTLDGESAEQIQGSSRHIQDLFKALDEKGALKDNCLLLLEDGHGQVLEIMVVSDYKEKYSMTITGSGANGWYSGFNDSGQPVIVNPQTGSIRTHAPGCTSFL